VRLLDGQIMLDKANKVTITQDMPSEVA
jgi:hypothetical protein